jgi:hypothetical protein
MEIDENLKEIRRILVNSKCIAKSWYVNKKKSEF